MCDLTGDDETSILAPFVDVAPDAWFSDRRTTLTYCVPNHLAGQIEVGQLVWVPLRRKLILAVIVERHDREPKGLIPRDLHARVEPAFCLTPLQWKLSIWIAEQTQSSLFEAASLMFPPGTHDRAVEHVALLRPVLNEELELLTTRQRLLVDLLQVEGEMPLVEARKTLGSSLTGVVSALERAGLVERIARIKHRPLPGMQVPLQIRLVPSTPPPPERAPKQRYVYDTLSTRLRSRPDLSLPLDNVLGSDDPPIDRPTINALARRGCLVIEPITLAPISNHVAAREIVLTDEQQQAWGTIRGALNADAFRRVLLHGVTGSGKTELYLRAVGHVLARGRSAIVLAPEIALSGQIADRFAQRFGARAVVLHSALDDRARSHNWDRTLSGESHVVIGPRSALFAPLPAIGLIVVDEEHEPAYKQDSTPRYHARSVAERLAELHQATLVLGSATPDVETYFRSSQSGWERVTLSERVGQRVIDATGELSAAPIPLPTTRIVDLRAELREGNPSIFSRRLVRVIEARLDAEQQVILFLNRRGASTLVQCRACGDVSLCPFCDVPLTYHRIGDRLTCHRCGYRAAPPTNCLKCGARAFSYLGVGVQRVEAEIADLFPEARVMRWDRDALRGGVRHEDLLGRVSRREVDILVGTQMIAKGLDLPGIGAVGIINADTFLYLPDIRSAERTFQMLTQVAGRAARRTAGGEVVIQTYSPQHYAIAHAARHDFQSFYIEETAYRRAHGYPPFKRLIRLLYRHQDEAEARLEADRLASALTTLIQDLPSSTDVDLLGPAPAFATRLRGRYGWQLLVRGSDALRVVASVGANAGWMVDIDPVSLL